MKLHLHRIALRETYTIGKLYVDYEYFCDTLEDKVRDLNHDGDLNDAGETKVWGETAIPYGKYKVILNYSNRFKRVLPRLLNVNGFDGILIHPGNTAVDTHGCILVGINDVKGQIHQSRATFDKLFEMMKQSGQTEFEITVE